MLRKIYKYKEETFPISSEMEEKFGKKVDFVETLPKKSQQTLPNGRRQNENR